MSLVYLYTVSMQYMQIRFSSYMPVRICWTCQKSNQTP